MEETNNANKCRGKVLCLTLPEYLQTLLVYKSILEMVRQMALEVHSVALFQATVHAFGYTGIMYNQS